MYLEQSNKFEEGKIEKKASRNLRFEDSPSSEDEIPNEKNMWEDNGGINYTVEPKIEEQIILKDAKEKNPPIQKSQIKEEALKKSERYRGHLSFSEQREKDVRIMTKLFYQQAMARKK